MLRSLLLTVAVLGLGAVEPATAPASASRPQAVIETTHGAIRVELFRDECPKTVDNFLGLAMGTIPFTVDGVSATAPFYDGLTFHRVIKDFMIQGGCPKGNGSGGPGYAFEDEINPAHFGFDDAVVQKNAQGQPDANPRMRMFMAEFQQYSVMPLLARMGVVPGVQVDDAKRNEVMAELMKITIRTAFADRGYRYRDDLPPSRKPTRGMLCMANSGPNTNGSQFFINVIDTPWLDGRHTVFGRVVEGQPVVDAISLLKTDPISGQPATPVRIISIRLVTP